MDGVGAKESTWARTVPYPGGGRSRGQNELTYPQCNGCNNIANQIEILAVTFGWLGWAGPAIQLYSLAGPKTQPQGYNHSKTGPKT